MGFNSGFKGLIYFFLQASFCNEVSSIRFYMSSIDVMIVEL